MTLEPNTQLNDNDFELLSAYIDDQLSPTERNALEVRLKNEPILAQTLAELQDTVTLLQNLAPLSLPRSLSIPEPKTKTLISSRFNRDWSQWQLWTQWGAIAATIMLLLSFGSSIPLPQFGAGAPASPPNVDQSYSAAAPAAAMPTVSAAPPAPAAPAAIEAPAATEAPAAESAESAARLAETPGVLMQAQPEAPLAEQVEPMSGEVILQGTEDVMLSSQESSSEADQNAPIAGAAPQETEQVLKSADAPVFAAGNLEATQGNILNEQLPNAPALPTIETGPNSQTTITVLSSIVLARIALTILAVLLGTIALWLRHKKQL